MDWICRRPAILYRVYLILAVLLTIIGLLQCMLDVQFGFSSLFYFSPAAIMWGGYFISRLYVGKNWVGFAGSVAMLNRVYLIAAVLLTIIGLFEGALDVAFRSFDVFTLFYLSPAAILWGTYLISRLFRSRKVHYFAIPICLAAVCWWWWIVFAGTFVLIASPVQRLWRYEAVLKSSFGFPKDLIDHFPQAIPPDARHARFIYFPSFMLSGSHIQLRYNTTPEHIGELYRRFSVQKTRSYFGGSRKEHMKLPDGMPTTMFFTGDFEDQNFPDDYEIMIFDKPPYNRTKDASHGVAISKRRNVIVYWAEMWMNT